jgi:hypothetical protein
VTAEASKFLRSVLDAKACKVIEFGVDGCGRQQMFVRMSNFCRCRKEQRTFIASARGSKDVKVYKMNS